MAEPGSLITEQLHIWRLNPKTGRPMQWVGSWHADTSEAFKWMDKHGGGRDKYVLNNVPPFNSRTQNPARAITVKPDGTRVQGSALPRKDIPGKGAKTVSDFERQKAAERAAYNEQLRKAGDRANRGGNRGGVEGSRSTSTRRKAKPDNSPEAKRLREQAAAALNQHRRDEASDLEKGINR